MKESSEQLASLRHSCAHLLAAAVKDLWPGTHNAIGPSIDTGFYQDFDFGDHSVSEDDLPKIEKRMREMLAKWGPFAEREVSLEEARKAFADNPYKLELLEEFAQEGKTITVNDPGDFLDLCKGGHSGNPQKDLQNFTLLSVAGAYWRGDENNKMLTRIYGTCFPSAKALKTHLQMLAEAKKRDHRKLGQELDLFTFSDLVGPGLPLWTPHGTRMRHVLDEYVWELRRAKGYERVEIPHITKKDLYETSGHWQKFSDELFRITTREGHEFAMKPMNCPHHTQLFARRQFSYRDMPQRYANTTMCYRDEQTGELHGLSRVRSFTQDDAHVFCRHSQVASEMLAIWDIVNDFYRAVGFEDLSVRLSFYDPQQPEKYLGDAALWESAQQQLREVVAQKGVEAQEAIGEAAFYGPKIDFMAHDSIGREWQVATIQLDMNLPERFDLTCVDENGEKERVVMIHAAIMGSIERFLSIIIEHHAGAFPVWFAPVQVVLASVGEDHKDVVPQWADELRTQGIRVHADVSDESVGKKVRVASQRKVPYVVIVGDKEVAGGDWQVRVRGQEEQLSLSKEDFVQKMIAHNTART